MPSPEPPVVVVGAGVAGLAAALELRRRGVHSLVLEREAVGGGRLATPEVGRVPVDAGAQFFTVRSDEMVATTARWLAAGLVREWCRGFGPEPDDHPRYVGVGGMARLAARLLRGLDHALGCEVDHLVASGDGWRVEGRTMDGPWAVSARGVVLTPPPPVTAELLDRSGGELGGAAQAVGALTAAPTLALLVALDGEPAVPAPGGVQLGGDPFSFVADNRTKGLGDTAALTLHVAPAPSAAWFDEADAALTERLLADAGPWIGAATVRQTALVRWRHATPTVVHPDRTLVAATDPGPVVVAGDAFAGPKIEGAWRSGLAAGREVAARLPR